MVSIKALALLTLSASAVTAVPQFGHARFHARNAVDLPEPTGTTNTQHNHNDTDFEPIAEQAGVDVPVPTAMVALGAPVRRWERTRTWGGNNPWSSAAASASAVPNSVVAGSGSATASADTGASTGSSNITTTGSKKGLSYNTNSLLTQFNSAGASWAYNWAAGAGGSVPSGVEYVPMLWGQSGISAWAGAVKTAIAGGAKHVLSFNEPDFPEQANLAAGTAATLHIANVASLSGQVKVGSPAFTNSNIAGQGLDWAKAFLAACGGASNNCKIDFLAFHWYNVAGQMDNFKSHVSTVISLAKANNIPKVWLTEFAVTGTSDEQAAFVQQAIPYLDSLPEVERYAYFMVGNGQMLSNNALNVVGKAYAG